MAKAKLNIQERATMVRNAATDMAAQATKLEGKAAQVAADQTVSTFATVMDVAMAAYKDSRRVQVETCTAIGFAIVANAAGWIDGKSVGLTKAVENARAYITGQGKKEMSGTDKATFKRGKGVAARLVRKPSSQDVGRDGSALLATIKVAPSIGEALSLLMADLDAAFRDIAGHNMESVADLDLVLFGPKAEKEKESPWAKLASAIMTRLEKTSEDGAPTEAERADLETACRAMLELVGSDGILAAGNAALSDLDGSEEEEREEERVAA